MPDTLVLVVCAGLPLLLLEWWLATRLRQQQDRMLARLDAVAARWASRAGVPATAQTAPQFELPDLHGRRVSLDALLDAGKPVLLLFAEPRCGPCYELLPDIGGWQRVYGDRLTITLVSAGAAAQNRAMTAEYGIDHVLLQEDREEGELDVMRAFGLAKEPAALLVRPDGTIGTPPSYGVPAIRALVAEILGLVLPESPVHEARPLVTGEAVPALRRPDLDGTPIDLAARGLPTLLVFWSPGCEHCRRLLPEMQQWATRLGGLRMLVVTRGPAALNREAGLAAPMIPDDDRTIARTFGLQGTPSAVLLDADGMVASELARGILQIQALIGHRLRPVAHGAD